MIQFNTLNIVDGTTLNIDVQVKSTSYYTNVYIDTIKIDNQDTFVSSGPSNTPKYTYTAGDNEKSKVLALNAANMSGVDLSKDLLFVYVTTKGTPSSDTPCGEDNTVTTGVVTYMYPIYTKGISYAKELEENCGCKINKLFINFILQLNAFEFAVKTKNYQEALNYWKLFYNNINDIAVTSTCNCNG